MTTEREALDRIAALCKHPDHDLLVSATEIRAILAEVTPEAGGDERPGFVKSTDHVTGSVQWFRDDISPEPGGTLDRDQAREWVRTYSPRMHPNTVEHALDALAGCVRPATIDREALVMLLDGWEAPQPLHLADAILALVRPVAAGVVLTPEDVVTVLKWHDHGSLGTSEDEALAARLEGAE